MFARGRGHPSSVRRGISKHGRTPLPSRAIPEALELPQPPVTGIRTDTLRLIVPRFIYGNGSARGKPGPRLTTTKSGARPPAVASQLSASGVHEHSVTLVLPAT